MIRLALPADAAAMSALYAPHVLTGTASFETEAPDTAEMAARLARVQGKGWPWLVWDAGDILLGYAYAAQFRDRAAYRATCENSICVAAPAARQGIGRALLTALFDAARAAGFREMIAVIGDGGGNHASVGLHGSCGFVQAGHLTNVGQKFGRRLDIIYMQRSL